jgi:DNA-binding NarL/FixJ family response regulator
MPYRHAFAELRTSSFDDVTILLADDFEPWRSHIRSFLQHKANWKIVFEARDGREAVQKTEELQPDVVLLDVGMPGLSGIEAAKKIRQLSPDSIIVFLSANAEEEVIAAAFEAGAVSYVLKREMATELVPAVQSALQARP